MHFESTRNKSLPHLIVQATASINREPMTLMKNFKPTTIWQINILYKEAGV